MPNPKARIYGALDVMYVDFGVFQGIVKLQSTIYCRPACPNDPPKSSKWSMINVNQPTNFRSVTCCETRHGLRRYWWRGGGQTAMRRYATNSSWMWHTTSKVFFFTFQPIQLPIWLHQSCWWISTFRNFQEKLTPISGVMELPLPKTLQDGCKSICSKKDHLFWGKFLLSGRTDPKIFRSGWE